MKKLKLFVYFSLLIGTAQAGVLDEIRERNLHVGYEEGDYIPFSYTLENSNKPIGYSQDIAIAIAERLKRSQSLSNLGIDYIKIQQKDRQNDVNNKRVDIYCSHFIIYERNRANVGLTYANFVGDVQLIVSKDSDIKDYSDIKGKKIAVTKGTKTEALLNKNKSRLKFERVESANLDQSLDLLSKGEIDGVFTDTYLGLGKLSMISDKPDNWQAVGKPLEKRYFTCFIPKEDTAFKKAVDMALADIYSSGEIVRIFDKWFKKPIPPGNVNFEASIDGDLNQIFTEPTDQEYKHK